MHVNLDSVIQATFFTSMSHLAIVGFVVFLGQVVYAAVGFGSGMVTISLLALIYGKLDSFVPFFLLLCIPTELYVAYRDRKLINFGNIGTLILAVLPTIVLGGLFLKEFAGPGLELLFGVLVSLLALYYLFFEDKWLLDVKGTFPLVIVGLLSGLLGSMFGLSGPPLIFYFKARKLKKQEFRVALLSIFFLMSLLRVVVYGAMGLYSAAVLKSAFVTLPFVFIGLLIGAALHHHISEELFLRLTSFLLLISGALLLARHFL